jgi:hypothetical protein
MVKLTVKRGCLKSLEYPRTPFRACPAALREVSQNVGLYFNLGDAATCLPVSLPMLWQAGKSGKDSFLLRQTQNGMEISSNQIL